MIRNLVAAAIIVAALAACGKGAKPSAPVEISDATFRPGQEWGYRTRPGEDSSTFTVLRVERAPELGIIVHIAVEGIEIHNRHDVSRPFRRIGHIPMGKFAVQRSVTRKLRDDAPLPKFEEGYRAWLSAHDEGHAGVFSTSVAEAVDGIAGTLQ